MAVRLEEIGMRKQASIGLSVVLLMGLTLVFSGCDHAAIGVTYVSTPPPPPMMEPVIVSPGPGYVWVQGYQTWNGNRYVWVPGHWESRPMGMHRWVAGHWRHNGHGWYWVPGHWR